jgi:competence protein ComEC
MTTTNPFMITIWDVGHGLSTWIQTPNGHNHWVDTGFVSDPRFSPSEHVYLNYDVRKIHYLTISHADKDHFDDLDNFIRCFGAPITFTRNPSVPFTEKYGSLSAGYQKALWTLDESHKGPVPAGQEPWNQDWNGGVQVLQCWLDWSNAGNINDSSIVTLYRYQGWLFILPGDIGPRAWDKLWLQHHLDISAMIRGTNARVLVAPHHGRSSGYSESMIEAMKPHLIVVSDEHGKEPTDYRFRTKASGLEHDTITSELKPISQLIRIFEQQNKPTGLLALLNAGKRDLKYLSMKSTGRLQFKVDASGNCKLHIVDS